VEFLLKVGADLCQALRRNDKRLFPTELACFDDCVWELVLHRFNRRCCCYDHTFIIFLIYIVATTLMVAHQCPINVDGTERSGTVAVGIVQICSTVQGRHKVRPLQLPCPYALSAVGPTSLSPLAFNGSGGLGMPSRILRCNSLKPKSNMSGVGGQPGI